MAFKNPTRDKVPKLGFIVRRPLGVVGNALGLVNYLAVTGFDMADEVRGRIFLAFTSEDNRGVPSFL